jgi:hypothetical protein
MSACAAGGATLDELHPRRRFEGVHHTVDGGPQPHREGRRRLAGQEVARRALEQESAVAEDADGVADLLDVGEDVAREEHGGAAAQV